MFFFDGVNEKKVYFCSLKSRGLLAQWFRALLSHGRGHRFNSYTTHTKKGTCKVPFFRLEMRD